MSFLRAIVAIGFVVGISNTASAQLSDMHAKVRVGGKLCFADHSHAGSSSGHTSRKAAEIAAIKSWQDFTAWEYGSAWGNYSIAVGKSMTCSGGGSWGCNIDARPCRSR